MGKSSGGGGGSTQQTTTSTPWAPSEPYLKEYMSLLNELVTGQAAASKTGANGLQSGGVPQQTTVGFNPTEQSGFGLELGEAGNQAALGNLATGSAGNIISGGNLNPASNPELAAYYNAAAQPLTANYEAATAPGINSAAINAGAFGGSAGAEASALGQYNFGNQLSNLAANIYEPAYQQGLQQQTQTLGLSPSLIASQTAPGETVLGVGGTQQTQAQNAANTAYQNQYNQFTWPYQQLQFLGSGLGLPAGSGGGSVAYGTDLGGGGSNVLSDIFGGGLAGLGGLSLLGGSGGAAAGLGDIASLIPFLGA